MLDARFGTGQRWHALLKQLGEQYMNKWRFLALLLLAVFSGHVWATQNVDVREAGIAFSLPETWEKKGITNHGSPPMMVPSDPFLIAWRRAAIVDNHGKAIMPGINVAAFRVPPEANVLLASSTLMHRRGWPFKTFLTSQKDGLRLPNSIGYLTEYPISKGVNMQFFVIHSINDGVFVEVLLSATDGVFPKVEPEFRAIIRSLRQLTHTQESK